MAINLRFIDFIVPISIIRNKYPGGWEKCLYDHSPSIGGPVWFDEHLFHNGAMSGDSMEKIVSRWNALGLEPTESVNGAMFWKDYCVLELLLGSQHSCKWLCVDSEEGIGYLNGTIPGAVVGRRPFMRRKTRFARLSYKFRRLFMRSIVCLTYGISRFNKSLTAPLNQLLIRLQQSGPHQ